MQTKKKGKKIRHRDNLCVRVARNISRWDSLNHRSFELSRTAGVSLNRLWPKP